MRRHEVPQSVVDIQIDVEAGAADAIELGRLEMLDLDEAFS